MNKKVVINVIVIACAFLFMIMLWTMDLSVSMMLNPANWGGVITNGFGETTPLQAYHFAIYSMIIVVFLLVVMNIVMSHGKFKK